MIIRRGSLIKEIIGELKYLQEKEIKKLMQEKREKEIEEILDEGMALGSLKFSAVLELCKEKGFQLKKEELFPELVYEMIFYFSKAGIKNEQLFMDKENLRDLLRSRHEEIPTRVANDMEEYELCDFSIHELLYGINPEQLPDKVEE